MKAVALTIEALALLNNEERKKERKKEREKERKKCKMALWPISVCKLLDSRKVQLVIKMKARYFLKL